MCAEITSGGKQITIFLFSEQDAQRFGSPAADIGKTRRRKITFSCKWPPHTYAEACRVIAFLPSGQVLEVRGSCGQAGGLTLPAGLDLDGSSGLWVSDVATGTLVHFKVTGS